MSQLVKPLSVAAYAKRAGVSHKAVQRAIESGRLSRSVVVVNGKPKIADPEMADREWKAKTRPRKVAEPVGSNGMPQPVNRAGIAQVETESAEPDYTAPEQVAALAPLDPDSYGEARRRRELELWRQAEIKRKTDELDLAARRGELVSVAEARSAVVEAYTVVRTKLLGLPSRVKQRLPHIAAADVVVIDDLIRDALSALADPVADVPAPELGARVA